MYLLAQKAPNVSKTVFLKECEDKVVWSSISTEIFFWPWTCFIWLKLLGPLGWEKNPGLKYKRSWQVNRSLQSICAHLRAPSGPLELIGMETAVPKKKIENSRLNSL